MGLVQIWKNSWNNLYNYSCWCWIRFILSLDCPNFLSLLALISLKLGALEYAKDCVKIWGFISYLPFSALSHPDPQPSQLPTNLVKFILYCYQIFNFLQFSRSLPSLAFQIGFISNSSYRDEYPIFFKFFFNMFLLTSERGKGRR